MSEANLSRGEVEEFSRPPACRDCSWHELPEGSDYCLNFRKLLCRLEPAAILERFFKDRGP